LPAEVLESNGLLLLFVTQLKKLSGHNILFIVATEAVSITGLANTVVQQGETFAILLPVIHVMETAFHFHIFIQHVPRRSTTTAILV
jgi:hypothetical protein